MPSLLRRRRSKRSHSEEKTKTRRKTKQSTTISVHSSPPNIKTSKHEIEDETVKVWRRSFGFSFRKPSPKKATTDQTNSLKAQTSSTNFSLSRGQREDYSLSTSSSGESNISSNSSSTLERRPSKVIAESKSPRHAERQELSAASFVTVGDDDERDDQSVDSVLVHKDYAKVVDALKVVIQQDSSSSSSSSPSQKPHSLNKPGGNSNLNQEQQPDLNLVRAQSPEQRQDQDIQSCRLDAASEYFNDTAHGNIAQSDETSTGDETRNNTAHYAYNPSTKSILEPTRPIVAEGRAGSGNQGKSHTTTSATTNTSTVTREKSSGTSSLSFSIEAETSFQAIERAIELGGGSSNRVLSGRASPLSSSPHTTFPSSTLSSSPSLLSNKMTGKTRRKFFGSSPKSIDKENEDLQSERRRNFTFIRQASPNRRKVSSATLARTREHAKQLAMLAGSPADGPESDDMNYQKPDLDSHLQRGKQSLNFSVFDADSSIISGNSSIVSNSISTAISANMSAYDMDSFDDASSAFSGFSSPHVIGPSSSRKSKNKLDQYVESHRKLKVMDTIDQRNSTGDAGTPFHPLSMKDRLSLVGNVPQSDAGNYGESNVGGGEMDHRSRISYPIPAMNVVNHDYPSNVNTTMRSSASVASHGSTMSGAAARRLMRRSLGEGLKSMQGTSQTHSHSEQTKEIPRRPNLPTHSNRYGNDGKMKTEQNSMYATPTSFGNSFEQGFSFDAFGLDETQVDDEVNAALALIAQSNPDLSLFDEADSHSDYNSVSNRSFNSSSSSAFDKATPSTKSTSSTTLSSPQDSPEDGNGIMYLSETTRNEGNFSAKENDNRVLTQGTYLKNARESLGSTSSIRDRFTRSSLPDISTDSERSSQNVSSNNIHQYNSPSTDQPSDEDVIDNQAKRELFVNNSENLYMSSESDTSTTDFEEERVTTESSSRMPPTFSPVNEIAKNYSDEQHQTNPQHTEDAADAEVSRLRFIPKRTVVMESDNSVSTASQLRAKEWASQRTSPILVSPLLVPSYTNDRERELESISRKRAQKWAQECPDSPVRVKTTSNQIQSWNHSDRSISSTTSHKRAHEWAQDCPDSPVKHTSEQLEESRKYSDDNDSVSTSHLRAQEWAQECPGSPVTQNSQRENYWKQHDDMKIECDEQEGHYPNITQNVVTQQNHTRGVTRSSDFMERTSPTLHAPRNVRLSSNVDRIHDTDTKYSDVDVDEMSSDSSERRVNKIPMHISNGHMLPGLSTEKVPLRKTEIKQVSNVNSDRFKSSAPSVPLRKIPPRPPRHNDKDEKKPSFLNQVKLKKTSSLHPYLASSREIVEVAEDCVDDEANYYGSEVEHYCESPPPISEDLPVNRPPPVKQSNDPKPKLTYKERRELELKAQAEAQQKETIEPQKKDRDVAALIKRRIAANRRNASKNQQHLPPQEREEGTSIQSLRNNLRKVSEVNPSTLNSNVEIDPPSPRNFYHASPPPSPPRDYYHKFDASRHHQNGPSKEVVSSGMIDSPNSTYHSRKENHVSVDETVLDNMSVKPQHHDIRNPTSNASNPGKRNSEIVEHKHLHQHLPERHSTQFSSRDESPVSTKQQQQPYPSEDKIQDDVAPKPESYDESDETLAVSKKSHDKVSSLFDQRASLMQSIKSKLEPEESDETNTSHTPNSSKENIASLFSQRASLMQSIKREGNVEDEDKEEEQANSQEDPNGKLLSLFANRSAQMKAKSISPNEPTPPPPPSENNGIDTSEGANALKDDPMYTKYFKMLTIGLPMDVVKHAMARDGLDPGVMDGDHNKPTKQDEGGMPLKDDPRYEKYFKMLKLGLPLGAVKNAMERDGEDPSVMDGDHNAPASSGEKKSLSKQEPLPKDKFRRTRLHWDTLRKVRSTSVWALVDKDPDVEHIEIDENEFAELFQAELEPSGTKPKAEQGKKRNAVKVIDPKRANNGGIILARLKITYEEMAMAVESMDDTILDEQQLQGIIEYIPTKEEKQLLRKYMTSSDKNSADAFDELCECEKFMLAMMTVKHSKQKMRALLFRLQFHQCISDLEREASMIENACDELKNSVRLRKLLGIVLNVGNRLNTAGTTRKGKAGAFSIESLLKLNQAKAFDKKTTFLHYVVLVVQRHNESLSCFKEDLTHVLQSDKIYWDQCLNDLEEVENQLENMRKIALNEVNGKKKRKGKRQHVDDDEMSQQSMSLEQEVEALRSTQIGIFTLDAIKIVSSLRENVEITKTKYAKLLEYFGEEGEKMMMPHELFKIIVTFTKDFDSAKEEVKRQEKTKKRDEQKQGKKTSGTNIISPEQENRNDQPHESERNTQNKPSRNQTMRLSSMQPNMSAVLTSIKEVANKNSKRQLKPQPQSSDIQGSYEVDYVNKSITPSNDQMDSRRGEILNNEHGDAHEYTNSPRTEYHSQSDSVNSPMLEEDSPESHPQIQSSWSGSTISTNFQSMPSQNDDESKLSLPSRTHQYEEQNFEAESRTTPPREATSIESVTQATVRDKADEQSEQSSSNSRRSSEDLLRQRARAMRQKRRMTIQKGEKQQTASNVSSQNNNSTENSHATVRRKAPTPGDMRQSSMSSNQRLAQRRERLARRNLTLHGRS